MDRIHRSARPWLRMTARCLMVVAISLTACGRSAEKPREQGRDVWNDRSPCNQTIQCVTNPADVENQCERAYGATSGKPYGLFCDCAPASNCSNSDCYSDCFRNGCLCGISDGRPNACNGVPLPPPNPDWGTCTCNVVPTFPNHRYWCCTNSPQGHTTDGWSCEDYCGAGNDVTTPPCSSAPPRGCNNDGTCEPDQGECCGTCLSDCCNQPLNCSSCQQVNECGTACTPAPNGTDCTTDSGDAGTCQGGSCAPNTDY